MLLVHQMVIAKCHQWSKTSIVGKVGNFIYSLFCRMLTFALFMAVENLANSLHLKELIFFVSRVESSNHHTSLAVIYLIDKLINEIWTSDILHSILTLI